MQNNLFARVQICLISGVIHACEWSLKNPTNDFIYGFQGVFIANVFSVLAVHIEKIIIELNVEHTPKTAFTVVALARDVLLPSSVNARSLAIKLFTSGE